jgi:cytosine/adenosine deaminase-related metal-dependent hydrolase
MQDLIVQNADHILTMDDQRLELRGADIRIRGGKIIELGQNLAVKNEDELVDARGCVITPGLVNTHHHLYQTLTRAVPKAQNALLFGWLQTLYPIWARFGPDEMRVSAMVGLAELALSGCTLSSDHLYLYPKRRAA